MNRRPELWRAHERAWLRKHAIARRFERIFKAADDAEDETNADDDTDDDSNGERHLVDELADLLVEAGTDDGALSREDALRYLLHSERGQALVARMAQARKHSTNTRTATMDHAVVKIAKAFVRTGKAFMSEDELTKLIYDYAQHGRLTGETPHQTFTRAYTAATAEGQLLRRAVAVAKQFSVGGGDHVNHDDAAEMAYAKLQQLADEQRRRYPDLTADRAFAKVFTDPANAALAAKAHRRPAATTSFPFPR
jgi:hypothetical protein